MPQGDSSMRTITVLTAMALILAALAYRFAGEEPASGPPPAATAPAEAASGPAVQDKLDQLAGALRHYQRTNQEQQARLNKTLADLEARLRAVEAGARERTTAGPDGAGRGEDPAGPKSGSGKPDPLKLAEADFGQWMDETLRVGNFDREATDLAKEQAGKSIAKLPGVSLEDLLCGQRFCRATFAHESGEEPAVQALFGEPPFMTEGFTIHEPDGRVSLYFVRPGESLQNLRGEAVHAAE
jgi:hypothetical protein